MKKTPKLRMIYQHIQTKQELMSVLYKLVQIIKTKGKLDINVSRTL